QVPFLCLQSDTLKETVSSLQFFPDYNVVSLGAEVGNSLSGIVGIILSIGMSWLWLKGAELIQVRARR
ncbi:MAG: PDGLE domain-containing protein, partial [Paraprevotella sp.]|nr:PDGLE domain-containing protein [Paraprevotella sp.]